MRKTNRFVALLMALILVFSSAMSTAVFANEDVVGTDFEVTVGKLKAVGIMEGYPDGTFKPEGEITRAEFAKIAVVALGLGDAAEVSRGVTRFPDVPATHWATGYINLAVNRGILVGYPNGTFQPNGKLTNAEAATILVRLVGLGPVVDKQGTWPANYIGRAANEGILKGVNVASSTNSLRGLTAKMLLNTLEVPLWGARGYDNDGSVNYGKLDPETTLLENMLNIDVVEGRVLAIPRVDSSLEDDEITIDEDGDDVTLVNKTTHSADHLFGLKVNAWVNDDDEIIYAEVKTAASDIIYDSVVSADEATDKLELLVKDKNYDVVSAYDLFLNYDDGKDLDDVDTEAGNNTVYGKVVLEKGKVIFAHLFSFDVVDAGVVTDVDKTVLTYLSDVDDFELDLDDYSDDEVVVMTAGFMAADVNDIKENTVMYAFEDGDDLVVVVAGEVVEGKLNRVRVDDARIAGKDYNVTDLTTVSTDDNDDVVMYEVAGVISDESKALVNEDVVAILDINGDLRHVVGDADVTSDTMYGLAVDAYVFGPDRVVRVFNAEGKKVAYTFDKNVDAADIITHFSGTPVLVEDSAGGPDLLAAGEYVAVSFKLNKDGKIDDGTFTTYTDVATENIYTGAVEFNKDRNRIEVAGDIFYNASSTVYMRSESNDDEALFTWTNVSGTSANITIYIVGDEGKNAKFVWISDNYSVLADDEQSGLVTQAVYYDGDDYIATVKLPGGTEIEVIVAAQNTVVKGDVLESFKVSSSNEAVSIDKTPTEANQAITAKDGDFLTINGTVYRLASDAVIYQLKTDGSLDKAISRTQVRKDDNATIGVRDGIIYVLLRH